MAFDENLAARIRDALARRRNIEEKKMFGCICFLLNGNALAGVWKDRLIARLGPDEAEAALAIDRAAFNQACVADLLIRVDVTEPGKASSNRRVVLTRGQSRRRELFELTHAQALAARLPGPTAVERRLQASA